MNNKIVNLNDDSFESSILQVSGLLLVDFWAEWCVPCKRISSILIEVANEYDEKLTIAKLNIDENPVTIMKYGIRSIPTLLLFRNGKVVATKIGAISKGLLKEFLNANL